MIFSQELGGARKTVANAGKTLAKRERMSMRNISRRATRLVSLGVLALPLGAAATAYACTSVATLSESPGAALAGSTVTVSGAFYGIHNPADATTAGPVEIRLGSLSGPVLATATPSGADKSFSVQVTIPRSAVPGDTFLAATQANPNGTPVYGTPARQAFTVSAPPAAARLLFGPPIFTPSCSVPDLTGLGRLAATRQLVAAHCAVGTVTRPATKPHRGTHHFKLVVASAGSRAGTTLANRAKVSLRLRWV